MIPSVHHFVSVAHAPRRPCAPPSLRFVASALLLVSLVLSLTLRTEPARAGQWSVTYSGTTSAPGATYNFTNNHVTGPPPFDQVSPSNFTLGPTLKLSATAPGTATMTVTTTLTWAASYFGDTSLPPSSVGVIEISSANGSINWVNPVGVKQTADDGFGDSPTFQTPPLYGAISSGSHFTAVPVPAGSKSVTLPNTRTLTATLSCTSNQGGNGSGGLILTYTAFPTNIVLTGPVQDSSGNLNILVGQGCTTQFGPLPNNFAPSLPQWSVSNSSSTFQSWKVVSDPNNQSHTTESDGPGPLTNATASWFWDELKTTSETITGTETVTPPSGQGSAFSLTLTQPVTVVVPQCQSTGTGGAMQVNTQLDGSNGQYNLYAGPADTSTPGRGMEFKAVLTPPGKPFSGTGSLELVQTEIPNLTYTLTTGNAYKRSNNGQQGLDTSYDYGWDSPSTAPTYTSGDSPNISLTGVASAHMTSSFVDTLMYEPPGSSQYVPLATFAWSTNGSAQLPDSKDWKDCGSAGSLTPMGQTKFIPSIAFPSWPQNVGIGWSFVPAK